MNQDVSEQYKTPANLNARANLHARYSTNPMGWLPWVFGRIREQLPEKARILEAGCGPGSLWVENRDNVPAGWSLTLTDFSEGMAAAAREATAQAGLDAQCLRADVQELPFDGDTFDAVIANHMLYHVPDIGRGLREIKRVLKPGGMLFAATNGDGHMGELYDLCRAYSPGITIKQDQLTERFRLERGQEILARYFHTVARIDYMCDLRVDEAGPIVEYVSSMAGMGMGIEPIVRERDQFQAFLAALIQEREAIRISKSVGVLIART